MIRRFYLENEYGIRRGLNSPETGLLVNPDGLGYGMDASYTAIGSSFLRNYMKDKQQKITCTLIFGTTSPYRVCNEFIMFANSAAKLKLIYATDAGEYYRDVDLVDFSKGEISESRVMECDVQFQCQGLFYSNHTDRFVISRMERELRWSFRWPVIFRDYISRKMEIENTGHVPAPFEIEIYGYCENPVVAIVQNNKELYQVRFPTVLQVGEKIKYSSMDGNLYCYRVGSNGEEINFSDDLDINNTNFFKFPVGDSAILFSSDTEAINRTVLTIFKFYRAV